MRLTEILRDFFILAIQLSLNLFSNRFIAEYIEKSNSFILFSQNLIINFIILSTQVLKVHLDMGFDNAS